MKRWMVVVSVAACFVAPLVLAAADDHDSDSRIQRGFRIAPVPLKMHGLNHDLVGLGSYLVNAVGGCNDCHTCPSFAPGHSPYFGGDGQINAATYLAGGVPFGPFTSKNLTPDPKTGLPEQGNTFAQFEHLIRTGHDPDEGNRILQVMPWPVYRNMTDRDLRAIYEFLRAIPSRPTTVAGPTTCTMAGQ